MNDVLAGQRLLCRAVSVPGSVEFAAKVDRKRLQLVPHVQQFWGLG